MIKLFRKPKKLSLPFVAFLQATGLFIYVGLVSSFMTFMSTIFSNTPDKFYGPILALMVFVISAVISGMLVLGKAGMLFWDKKYKEAFALVGWTVSWAILYLIILISALTLWL